MTLSKHNWFVKSKLQIIVMLEKINGACFMHICLLYIYVALLREVKATLDEMIKNRGKRVGQLASKEKITSSPSISPVP